MDQNTVEKLKEALSFSPNNVPLRLHLAQTLFNLNRLQEAQEQYQAVLEIGPNMDARKGLANVFYAQKAYNKCNVILENLIDADTKDFELLLLHTRALQKENKTAEAISIYQQLLSHYPDFKDEGLDTTLRVTSVSKSDAEDLETIDNRFVVRSNVRFSDVGGMKMVKQQINLKIIQPLLHPEIYKAYGKKIGGGILLYGPPGCGKTHIARATAGEVSATFISVGLNDILDMWMGSSERNLHGVFQLARKRQPSVLFFDEIDALGASRSDMKQSSGKFLINQFLHELDGTEDNNEGILILGATNTPWHLDTAFRRPGRFDRIIFVPPPDKEAREAIFRLKLANKPTDSIDYVALADKTKDYSGADIEAVVDIAVEEKLERAIEAGVPTPLTTKDLKRSIKKHAPSTKEWFNTAKNFALYANESGLYDDILTYLNIKK